MNSKNWSPASKLRELSAEERARILEEWIANHSVGGRPLSDYAVSRESIYKEREDAQL